MKIAAGVEYCGLHYAGWQRQKHAPSLQQHVEQALAKVADHPLHIICAGRTDAGVHALYQVIHFETNATRAPHSWVLGGNVNLRRDISLLWAREVTADFHARFSATGRTYRYTILNRPSRPGVNSGLVTWEGRPLNEERMVAAAQELIGEHDFTSYRALACQAKSPVREIRRLDVKRQGDYVIIEIEANAFLHHMVRNISGVLMAIGIGKRPVDWAKQILAARDRTKGGVTAPAHGLYLINVDYPEEFGIPKPAIACEP